MGLFARKSILAKLHSGEEFASLEDVQLFQARLAAELEQGTVERIPVGKMLSHTTPEEWYREKETGVVYRYVPPEFPLKGHWGRVEKPEERSYFEQLCATDAPSKEDYPRLVAELEQRWRKGEVERAPSPTAKVEGVMLYHHRPSDETFELFPPLRATGRAVWQKVFRSNADGTWPGKLKLDVPPARRGA